CVPRLHQHSLLELQDEIKRFDWRATLRQIVAEELRKQKRVVQKQQRARLDELQQALRRMDRLQLKQRTHEATAKMDELASRNIKEFASDVDTLIADKLDAAFSIFKTDTLSLEHVAFVKNLLTLEDAQKGDGRSVLEGVGSPDRSLSVCVALSQSGNSFWWKRMDESIMALDRLSAAVNKPEELERVLVELKQVLSQTSSSSPSTALQDSSSSSTEGASVSSSLFSLLSAANFVPVAADSSAASSQLQLFRSRIDGLIDKTRTSLKSRISQQVYESPVFLSHQRKWRLTWLSCLLATRSKVSSAVTSNVQEYVDTVKEETEALSAIVQDELDDVASSISKNLPFMLGLQDDKANANTASQSPSEKNEDGDVFSDVEPSEQVGLRLDDEQRELQQEQQQWEDDNLLRHEPLFPPGRILYLNRVVAPGPSLPGQHNSEDDENDGEVPDVVEFVEVATDEFSRVVLSNRMLLDHLCTDYERVLQSQAKQQPVDVS
ncbi:hypothetical protein BBJ28_00004429, partial [Nothophytophthora sp. Chile5]